MENNKKYVTTRAVYKAIKKYDHQQFDEFCKSVYVEGYNAGLKQPAEEPEASVSIEEVLKVIGEVKGVGPALTGKIRNAVDNMIAERRIKGEKQIN
ncbi:MAG: glutathione peroxidase [Eubacteriales bacterium]|nr:glutathione peroxidase [Eubacteriales bacterium]